jgi:hypothetical protein
LTVAQNTSASSGIVKSDSKIPNDTKFRERHCHSKRLLEKIITHLSPKVNIFTNMYSSIFKFLAPCIGDSSQETANHYDRGDVAPSPTTLPCPIRDQAIFDQHQKGRENLVPFEHDVVGLDHRRENCARAISLPHRKRFKKIKIFVISVDKSINSLLL